MVRRLTSNVRMYRIIVELSVVLSERDAKVSKITKFQNKLKESDGNFKKKIQEAVLKEVKELNLSKFISEIV